MNRLVAYACAGLLTGAGMTGSGHREESRVPVPVVDLVQAGCTTHRSLIKYHVNGGPAVVHAEGLLLGGWYEDPTLVTQKGAILVPGPYGRWRLRIDRDGYSITGPAAGPFGDLCVPAVDAIPVP